MQGNSKDDDSTNARETSFGLVRVVALWCAVAAVSLLSAYYFVEWAGASWAWPGWAPLLDPNAHRVRLAVAVLAPVAVIASVAVAFDRAHLARKEAHDAYVRADAAQDRYIEELATRNAEAARANLEAAVAAFGDVNTAVRSFGAGALRAHARENPSHSTEIIGVLTAHLRTTPPEPDAPTAPTAPTAQASSQAPHSAVPTMTNHEAELRNDVARYLAEIVSTSAFPDLDRINLRGAVFGDYVDWRNSLWRKRVDLSGAHFTGRVRLGGSRFKSIVSMDDASIAGNLEAPAMVVDGHADFRNLKVLGTANFSGAAFRNGADFRESSFSTATDFSRTTFGRERHVTRPYVSSGPKTQFSGVRFATDANFEGARIFGDARLETHTRSARPKPNGLHSSDGTAAALTVAPWRTQSASE